MATAKETLQRRTNIPQTFYIFRPGLAPDRSDTRGQFLSSANRDKFTDKFYWAGSVTLNKQTANG